jgi:hypothetical protein
MTSMPLTGTQDMDEELEAMWTESTQAITVIDPGEFCGVMAHDRLVRMS